MAVELPSDDVLRLVNEGMQEWSSRHDQIREERDIRYGRDSVLSTIPIELQSTDFEYHSSDLDDAVIELTAFLTGAELTVDVKPPNAKSKGKADDIESILHQIFKPNGVLDTEAPDEVDWLVVQNACENGQGTYKLTLKRDYPLRMPQRAFLDDDEEFDADVKYEKNPQFNPRSRKDSRGKAGKTRFRETEDSLTERRESFQEDEFPWQWRSVDPTTRFKITQDGVEVIGGELTERSATVLDRHGQAHLKDVEKGFTYLSGSEKTGGQQTVVKTLELWTHTHGYFAIVGNKPDKNGKREMITLKSWRHPYGRTPYYEALGVPTTDPGLTFAYAGAFGKMQSEIPLLNHLETMHFNAIHRGFFPMYYPVKDAAFGGQQAPMEAEQMVAVTSADMERTELPPGWKWEIMPSGFEPDLMAQLQASRERVNDSAVKAVLSGASPGSSDSGAKISLLISAATRAISPFVRHREGAIKEMMETMLRVSKRLKLDLNVEGEEISDDGTSLAKKVRLKPEDIVSTTVEPRLNIKLPVDQAAEESRGLTLLQAKAASYETVAARHFGIGDPQAERDRIAIETRETQIDDLAFQLASVEFGQRVPEEVAAFMGGVNPAEPAKRTVGGGPQGTFGGASAMIGRGGSASPSATQIDSA